MPAANMHCLYAYNWACHVTLPDFNLFAALIWLYANIDSSDFHSICEFHRGRLCDDVDAIAQHRILTSLLLFIKTPNQATSFLPFTGSAQRSTFRLSVYGTMHLVAQPL